MIRWAALLQHLAVRLPHHVSWVHNGYSEDPRSGNGGRHERARPKSEAAWCMSLQAAVDAGMVESVVIRGVSLYPRFYRR